MRALIEGFGLGAASILTNVCLLPLYPGMIAFLAGQGGEDRARWRSGWLGLVVLLGVFSMLLLIGLFFTVVSGVYAAVLPVVVLISYVFVVILGGVMLAGWNPFARLTTVQMPMLDNPFAMAYVYGLLLAPVTLPCTGALLLAAVGRVAGLGSLTNEMIFLLGFSLGFGWPLVVLPLVAVPAQRRFIGWMTSNHTRIERAAGLLLLVIGIYGLIVDFELFRELLA